MQIHSTLVILSKYNLVRTNTIEQLGIRDSAHVPIRNNCNKIFDVIPKNHGTIIVKRVSVDVCLRTFRHCCILTIRNHKSNLV